MSLIQFNKIQIDNLSIEKTSNQHYKHLLYNGENFYITGPKMYLADIIPDTLKCLNIHFKVFEDLKPFIAIDKFIILNLKNKYPHIENIYIQCTRRSIKDDHYYLRNHRNTDIEPIFFNNKNEPITLQFINENINKIDYVIPLLHPILKNDTDYKSVQWSILQLKVFMKGSKDSKDSNSSNGSNGSNGYKRNIENENDEVNFINDNCVIDINSIIEEEKW